jgi:carboxypeptidase Taq
MHAYHSLERRFARLGAIHDAIGILQWDTETMMPDGAIGGRSEQLATLKGIAHELLTAREVGDLLDEVEQGTDGLTEWQHANLR